MKLRLALLIGFLAPAVVVAQDDSGESEKYFPQRLTAKDLSFYCAASSMNQRGRERQRYCSGFVSGVEEAVRLLGRQGKLSPVSKICVPHEMSARQFTDVYIRYSTRKDTDLNKPAALVVIEALENAYPCKNGE